MVSAGEGTVRETRGVGPRPSKRTRWSYARAGRAGGFQRELLGRGGTERKRVPSEMIVQQQQANDEDHVYSYEDDFDNDVDALLRRRHAVPKKMRLAEDNYVADSDHQSDTEQGVQPMITKIKTVLRSEERPPAQPLPDGWIMTFHNSGIQSTSTGRPECVTWSRPYFLELQASGDGEEENPRRNREPDSHGSGGTCGGVQPGHDGQPAERKDGQIGEAGTGSAGAGQSQGGGVQGEHRSCSYLEKCFDFEQVTVKKFRDAGGNAVQHGHEEEAGGSERPILRPIRSSSRCRCRTPPTKKARATLEILIPDFVKQTAEEKPVEGDELEVRTRVGKQLASQKILQMLHPHVKNWGSPAYVRPREQQDGEKENFGKSVIELQQYAKKNKPNLHILNKLQEEMRKLAREREETRKKPKMTVVESAQPGSEASVHRRRLEATLTDLLILTEDIRFRGKKKGTEGHFFIVIVDKSTTDYAVGAQR
ncbi:hypothetical protein AMELA_G00236400 [Ameiurus melas]|uniref:Uncharacterized protein n=1 Tax=Ameiurus melas TaxID=219545 RepID=A0A7J5ZUG6_AMEME|nr:hypothetical protein AMELA_G00236400 [Ameiurus melas]